MPRRSGNARGEIGRNERQAAIVVLKRRNMRGGTNGQIIGITHDTYRHIVCLQPSGCSTYRNNDAQITINANVGEKPTGPCDDFAGAHDKPLMRGYFCPNFQQFHISYKTPASRVKQLFYPLFSLA